MKKNTVSQTIKAYDKNADKYAEKFDNYAVYQKKISEFQNKFISPGTHILDLGCGPGNNIDTIYKNDQACSFTGVDLSRKFISIAKERFPHFSFLERDLRKLELTTKFETILASFCIVHLKDEETIQFIKNISEILEAGGHLYLSYMNGDSSGFESTSFSKEEIFFNYYEDSFILDQLTKNNIHALEVWKENYIEADGSVTVDTFIYAMKNPST